MHAWCDIGGAGLLAVKKINTHACFLSCRSARTRPCAPRILSPPPPPPNPTAFAAICVLLWSVFIQKDDKTTGRRTAASKFTLGCATHAHTLQRSSTTWQRC